VTLTFDAVAHRYSADGVPLVSVTQAIREAGLMGDTSFWTAEARDRGTFVHAMTQMADEGDLDEETLDPSLEPYLVAYRAFLADHRPTWSHIETPRADLALRYAGTVDRAGRLKGIKHPVVLDVKSGAPADWVRFQLSAYKHLVAAELGAALIARYALYLSPDGSYRLVPLPLADGPDWQMFCASLAIAQWKRRFLK
jgi:hypothetical protein